MSVAPKTLTTKMTPANCLWELTLSPVKTADLPEVHILV